MSTAAALAPGSLVSGFRVEGEIGRGGMGVVYRATQLSLGRQVALKLISAELALEERFRERFLREARLAASLEHPHLLPVYEAGEAQGTLFLAMRLVEGDSLADLLLRERPLVPERALRLLAQLASALQTAHEAGLLHRDVKPANVLIAGAGQAEHAYLCDFGLARRLAGGSLTQERAFLGTASYAAPEQIRGEPLDARCDLYALACLLYDCLTGVPPYQAEDELALCWAHLHEPVPLPSSVDPELAGFDPFFARALAKDPAERFDSASALAQAALAGALPQAPPAAGPPIELPRPATPFLGRERELAELLELLLHEDVRLLTLTGPGGTGKTRLALQAATAAADLYPDGVTWVPLAPLRDPDLVLPTIAKALQLPEQPDASVAETLPATLAGKRALIVVDNAEHLLPGLAPQLALLIAISGPILLVTSRERLHVQGEQLYPVSTLEQDEGEQLFLARARALDPHFEANGVLTELCSRLDNLPLALELAAARTPLFSPRQLLERLSRRLDLLHAEPDADPRQQTLRATIEWSYDLLTAEEQGLFRALSVFAGGCTFEAAEEVAGAVPDTLQSLLDKNLLRRRMDAPDQPRYWMLETIREFAAERLDESGEEEHLRDRHLDWTRVLAEAAFEGLRSSEARRWLEALEREQGNLRAALAWAEQSEPADALLDLAGHLWSFWATRGHWREARRWTEIALARSEGQRTRRRIMALHAMASFNWSLGNQREVTERAEEALSISREIGDQLGIFLSLQWLGVSAYEAGDHATGERLLADAIEHARDIGELRAVAWATGNLADFALRQKDYERGIALSEQALGLFREHGLEEGIGFALNNLAFAYFRTQRDDEALKSALESLRLAHGLGDVACLVWNLVLLAALAARRGRAEHGARLLGAADTVQEGTGMAEAGSEAQLVHETVEALRSTLGEERYDRAFAEGRDMAIDDAVGFAVRALGSA